jgi:hypothetical protein
LKRPAFERRPRAREAAATRRRRPSSPTPEEYRGALLRWQEQHFNVLTPFSNISGLAPAHGIYSSAIHQRR